MKLHPSKIHREEHREVTEPAPCTMSSAAVTDSPISSLLTAGTVMQHTALSQTLQCFVHELHPKQEAIQSMSYSAFRKIAFRWETHFFFLHTLCGRTTCCFHSLILHNQNGSFHLIVQADAPVRFLATTVRLESPWLCSQEQVLQRTWAYIMVHFHSVQTLL